MIRIGSGRFGFDRLGSRTQAGDVTQQEARLNPTDAAVTFISAHQSVGRPQAEPEPNLLVDRSIDH